MTFLSRQLGELRYGLRIIFFTSASLIIAAPAAADLFDDIVNKTREAVDKAKEMTAGDTADDAGEPAQDVAQPDYDVVQVMAIQERLNALGYDAGPIDGQLGEGTRSAITEFQRDNGLAANGEPSAGLLGRIEQAESKEGVPGSADDAPPEPTVANMMLAAVHLKPELLDDDQTLQTVLLAAHPELGQDVSNEFKWRKNKADYKAQMLAEAAATPLEYAAMPWRRKSVSQTRRIELVEYDFDREAFRSIFSIGVARQILPKMFLAGNAEPDARYVTQINYIAMSMDDAERISNYFDNKQRNVYPAYRLRVTGVDARRSRPSPIVEFVDDTLSLYALTNGRPFASNYRFEYEHLIDVKLPTTGSGSQDAGRQRNARDARSERSRERR